MVEKQNCSYHLVVDKITMLHQLPEQMCLRVWPNEKTTTYRCRALDSIIFLFVFLMFPSLFLFCTYNHTRNRHTVRLACLWGKKKLPLTSVLFITTNLSQISTRAVFDRICFFKSSSFQTDNFETEKRKSKKHVLVDYLQHKL